MNILMSDGKGSCADYLKALQSIQARVADFYLWLGRQWPEPGSPPFKVSKAPAKLCYRNAFVLAEQRRLTYCEGYACPEGLIPLHHAWCVTADGAVIDPTWLGSRADYFGVALDMGYVRRCIHDSGVWGVLGDHVPRDLLQLDPLDYLDPAWLPSNENLQRWKDLLQSLGLGPGQSG